MVKNCGTNSKKLNKKKVKTTQLTPKHRFIILTKIINLLKIISLFLGIISILIILLLPTFTMSDNMQNFLKTMIDKDYWVLMGLVGGILTLSKLLP